MAETERDNLDALAGEYVLGTLAADERLAAEARLATDPAFRGAVAAWEARLQPLADAAHAVPLAAGGLDRIMAEIDRQGTGEGETSIVTLRRSLRRWRTATALAGAIAAVLAGLIVVDRYVLPQPQTEFVAVLTAGGDKPAFVATVDTVKGTIAVRRVATPAPPDKSYELWAVASGAAPKSLGLVENASLSRPLPVAPKGLTLAISLEPKGGSPTGSPTGPVVFSGTLVPTE